MVGLHFSALVGTLLPRGTRPPYEALYDSLPWQEINSGLFRGYPYQMFIGSGLLLAMGLLGRFGTALWALQQGARPDFVTPVVRLVAFVALMGNYQPFVQGVVHFAAELGDSNVGQGSVEQLWETERKAYAAHWEVLHEESRLAALSRDSLVNGNMEFAAHLGLCLSHGLIFAVRAAQAFFLLVLFLSGPWLMALALLGGPFVGLCFNWLRALFEVSSWSWGLKALAFGLRQMLPVSQAGVAYSVSRGISTSVALSLLVALTPWVMARIWRGLEAKTLGDAMGGGPSAAAGLLPGSGLRLRGNA